MTKWKRTIVAGLIFGIFSLPTLLLASSVRHMNLEALSENAGLIFRGTVTGVQVGTVELGGAELPTTTYSFRVSEMFKGEPTATKEDDQFIAITMVGSIKVDEQDGDIARFDRFRDVPRLRQGDELLLFTTVESAYGLSVTVGLAQGCFDIDGGMALNRAGNVGLFYGMAYAGPASGPIAYDELATRIRAALATR